MAENNVDFVWEHVITVSEEDLDQALDTLHDICERRNLQPDFDVLENGDCVLYVYGPRVLAEEAALEYFREYT